MRSTTRRKKAPSYQTDMKAFRNVSILFFVLALVLGNEVIGSSGLICGMSEVGLMSCQPSVTVSRIINLLGSVLILP